MTSTQTLGYSFLRRTAIAVCLGTGLFFAFRAATPDAQATAAVPAVTVSPTVDAAVPDTELTTCNIEDIQAGDLVLARDEHGQEIGLKPVKEVYKRTSFHLRHLTFESTDGDQQALSTTDEHPFWSVTADEFLEAGSLPVGHKVTDPHGKTQTLVSSTREEFPNGIPVFNFQVEDFHTYYVAAHAGDDVLLVHNADYVNNAVSQIGQSSLLVREAEAAGRAAQASLDKLTHKLRSGNLDPGIGTKPIGAGISEARAADGARVYFRQLTDGTIEILCKSTKANQDKVIAEVLRLFGV